MLASDTLGRSYLKDIKSEFDKDALMIKSEFDKDALMRDVHFILSNLPISQSRLDQFHLETQNEQILQTLNCYTINFANP